jgi:CRP-like cAMP-binding protein
MPQAAVVHVCAPVPQTAEQQLGYLSRMPADLAALRKNWLLAPLDDALLATLGEQAQLVHLTKSDILLKPGSPIRQVWFPVEGIISLLASLDDGKRTVEVGTVGRDGMLGLAVFLGHRRSSGMGIVQVDGQAFRLAADVFEAAVQGSRAFTDALHRFTHAQLMQSTQGLACARAHSPLQRCARWLLTTGDRVGTDTFHLTQDLLARMLGDHRPTVSRAASTLRSRRLIAYSRGSVAILDREGLEALACPCYRMLRAEYERIS